MGKRALMISLVLLLVVGALLVACAKVTPSPSPTPKVVEKIVEKEKLYTVLNPESWVAPFEATPLSPRLDTLRGKVIGIVGQRHEPMLYLKDELLAAHPELNDVIILEGNFSSRKGISKSLEAEVRKLGINAVIQGIAH